MEFRTLAVAVLAIIILLVLVILAINVSGVLQQQVANTTGIFRL